MGNPYDWIARSLDTLHKAHWHRAVQAIDNTGPVITLAGQQLLNFASNDYLGLAGDPRLAAAAIAAVKTYGTSSTGSRLLSGHRPLHQTLEHAIAQLKQTEDALVFSSGYLANLGTIAALVGSKDLILSDQYNHSSLRNGATLSGATITEYRHCDMADLKQKLATQRDRYRRCLLLTDSVFSMDGDLCPLPTLLALAEQYECMVLVDEAHATGVLGKTGAGCVEHWHCTGRSLVQIGTLSKALGSLGGYVAGSAALIDYLRNRAATWIYTTGLSPADAAAALTAIAIVQAEPERRQRLQKNSDYLRQQLADGLGHIAAQHIGVKQLPSCSPIVCLQVQDAATVLHIGKQLKQAGIFAAVVRPPTVPTSRLRFTVMANHTSKQIETLITALTQIEG
ncbi:8-amino-7-oxononanoate synthase [Almyronema epifaneia]|uniref:8-amino-7-ketopelargonate synthase n=1 Tax=Almyronema epifaneia S1 TaxID=2991925 RepID=A0ABW6IBV6_9CYAN